MAFSFKLWRVVGICLVVLHLFSVAAIAQGVRPPTKKKVSDVLKIRKMTGLTTKGRVKTPEYRSSVGRGLKSSGDWSRVLVEYGTNPEWIDELVFQYYVLTLRIVDGKKAYSLFKTVVRYVDIPKDRRHLSTVFLRPNTVKRYGVPVAIAVEIRYNGQIVAVKNDAIAAAGLPDGEWWKNPRVVDNEELVTVRSGYLLNRAESPFALVNIDDYEAIK
ncbi:MAG: hypothetical protein KAH23_05585 [Kiritimatiellae bacterium]|nr:hypothetical protein [Kiritimatiellia bacterium]